MFDFTFDFYRVDTIVRQTMAAVLKSAQPMIGICSMQGIFFV